MDELRESVKRNDARKVEFLAHSLKSSVGNFSAWGAFNAAERLEHMARRGDMAEAAAAFAHLEGEIERLRPVLMSLGGG
jgi:HPt (histidine-containing phosphotransfer) domain-containing protein